MSKSYQGKAPLTMVRTVSPASYIGVLAGAPVPENIDPDDLKRLVDEGFLEEASGSGDSGSGDGGKPTSVKDILKDVGDDKAKAQEYLDEENAAEKPRATLVEGLQAVLAAE